MKLKFMTPEKERIEKEAIEIAEGMENEEKEKKVGKKMMENLFVNIFFFYSLLCHFTGTKG